MLRPRPLIVAIFAIGLLCQCATKHQPTPFPAYFPVRPDNQFSQPLLWERKELEAVRTGRSLDDLENKRLWELYLVEMRSLKKGCPRHAELAEKTKELGDEVKSLEEEVVEVQREVRKYKDPLAAVPPKPPLGSASARKKFQEAYNLWNKDENDLAFQKATALVNDSTLMAQLTSQESYRVHSLRFRIALDVGDLPSAEQDYQKMREAESCSAETAQGGFLVALHNFARGDHKRALTVMDSQCDPDAGPANNVRRKYWRARFLEPDGNEAANRLYEEVMRLRMPGYYVYLAKGRLGRTIELPKVSTDVALPYLAQPFQVSRKVDGLLSKAEERLRFGLRRDAGIFLTQASQSLKAEVTAESVPALLYTAHLLQAAGAHLEAMKIYSVVTTAVQEDLPDVARLGTGYLSEMFPRPFTPSVEWLSRQWGADPDFLYAVMRQESAFNPAAISSADARGLMQLMPALAKSLAQRWRYQGLYSDKILLNADENLKLATFHLYQLKFLVPHPVLMTASYNAGLNRVSGWWRKFGQLPLDVFVEMIPVGETRNYVKLVMRNYLYYKALRQNGRVSPDLIPFKLPPHPKSLFGEVIRSESETRVSQRRVPSRESGIRTQGGGARRQPQRAVEHSAD